MRSAFLFMIKVVNQRHRIFPVIVKITIVHRMRWLAPKPVNKSKIIFKRFPALLVGRKYSIFVALWNWLWSAHFGFDVKNLNWNRSRCLPNCCYYYYYLLLLLIFFFIHKSKNSQDPPEGDDLKRSELSCQTESAECSSQFSCKLLHNFDVSFCKQLVVNKK